MRFRRLLPPVILLLLCAVPALAQPTLSAATVTTITPNYGGTGPNSGGSWTIVGTGFSVAPKATRFVDNSNADIFNSVSCSSTTTCDVFGIRANRVPAGTVQTLAIFALVGGVKSASFLSFKYYGALVISSLSPSTGAVTGFSYAINGAPFTSGVSFPGTTSIYLFDSIVDLASGCASTSLCNANAPSLNSDCCAAYGARTVDIRTPGGFAAPTLIYGSAPATPTVTSVSPASGPPAGGTQTVTITGTNFITGINSPAPGGLGVTLRTSFYFITHGSSPTSNLATSVNCTTTTTCTAVVPSGTAGIADVQVFTVCPAGTPCNANARASVSIPGTKANAYTYTGLTISPGSATTLFTSEDGQSARFTVVLNTQPTASVSVALSTSTNPTYATLSASQLTFTTSNWNVPQVVTVTGIDDTGIGGAAPPNTGSFGYSVSSLATSADPNYNNVNGDQPFTNQDNEAKNIFITPQAGLVTTRGGGADQFTVVLTKAPTASVTVALTSNDPLEGSASPSSLTFFATAGGLTGWNVPRIVTVTGINDGSPGRDMPYSIITTVSATADSSYSSITMPDVQVTNKDTLAPASSAPAFMTATPISTNAILVSWTASPGATAYEVARSSGGAYTTLATLGGTGYIDPTALANTAYLYKVRAVAPSLTAYTAPDLATTVVFTDPFLGPGSPIKAVHFSDLRTAVDAVRALAGSGPFSFTDPTLTTGTTLIAAVHLTELRSALDSARATLALPAIAYTRPTITAQTSVISVADVNDLRTGVK